MELKTMIPLIAKTFPAAACPNWFSSLIAFLLMASAPPVEAQLLQTLFSFNGTNGASPQAALALGSDGNFYGTTGYGGITNSTRTVGMGTVFKMTTNGALNTLLFFNGTNGAWPRAVLTLGNDGIFYGTTEIGGITNTSDASGMGTVFQGTTNGVLTTLASFNATNGQYPMAGLTLGNDGNYYGTTMNGGLANNGTVFRVATNGVLTTLYWFTGGADGGGRMPR